MATAPISQTVAIADPDKPQNTVKVNDDRSINVVVTSGGGSTAVTIADGADVTLGAIADAAATAGGTGTVSAKLRRLSTQLPAALGQTTMSASLPVALASNQASIPVASTLQAGQANVGNVGGKTVSVTVTPTVTASNSYGINYVVGGKLTFANAFTSTGTGIIQSVDVNIKKTETSGFTLFLFSADPSNTTWTDAAVAAINAADMPNVRAPITLTANSQLAASGFTNYSATGLGIAMAPGTTSLYAVLLANAALTNQFSSTSDVSITIRILQDL